MKYNFMTFNVTQSVLYCTIRSDHGSRGRYDNPWSLLRPVQIGPLHDAPSVREPRGACVCR